MERFNKGSEEKLEDKSEESPYIYELDDKGRTVHATGDLHFGSGERVQSSQRNAGGEDRMEMDDGGHLIGARFDGLSDPENLVPMDRYVNRGIFKSQENEWARELEKGNKVNVDIEPFYSDEGERPTALMAKYVITDKDGNERMDYFSTTNIDLRDEEMDDLDVDGDEDIEAAFAEQMRREEADEDVDDLDIDGNADMEAAFAEEMCREEADEDIDQ